MRGKIAKILLVVLLLPLCSHLRIARAIQPQEQIFCWYAGLKYTSGACRGGQLCLADGTWVNASQTCG
jgi:hypothetical protein